jgi:hypothetical protein
MASRSTTKNVSSVNHGYYFSDMKWTKRACTRAQKVDAILSFPKPVTTTEMRSFAGLAGWYRRFVKDFASLVAPLYELTKTKKKKYKLEWTDEAEMAFCNVKMALSTAPVLATPNFNLPFYIHCDASKNGIGDGVLTFNTNTRGRGTPDSIRKPSISRGGAKL